MARTGISNLVRIAGRGLQTTRIPRTLLPSIAAAPVISQMVSIVPASAATARFVSQSSGRQNIKTPDNKPVEPKTVEMPEVIQTAADITDNEYHAIADEFMERMLHHFEELQETKADMDVEFSAGVLKVTLGQDVGVYVINKQPPNKQIWLSSPTSGPKRFDYVMLGDGQQDKQDTASGDWIYLRDGSKLTDILRDEIGVDITIPVEEI
ncbi:hypothetical protein QBC42DRAFT_284196 [Cladorrhinum samala]|uniref:ferroxidase n=1 Tax=Cladorrhinum samala TaxID=585594 RepID=A0AAV9HWX3_9PEZI|nr:hypothetical protein QBC42DRAFT_284196 [Cladorrhinum samala]